MNKEKFKKQHQQTTKKLILTLDFHIRDCMEIIKRKGKKGKKFKVK